MGLEVAEAKRVITEYRNWYHGFEVLPGVRTPGTRDVSDIPGYLKAYRIDGIKGKRILEVAAFDGGFAFGFEEAGAEVVAIDVIDESETGFHIARRIRGSTLSFKNCSVYDLTSEFGHFDYVHFSGIHYHLRHPYQAFEKLNGVLRDGGVLFGAGAGISFNGPVWRAFLGWQLYRRILNKVAFMIALDVETSPNNDPTNWFLFSDEGLRVMLASSGFRNDFVWSEMDYSRWKSTQMFKATKISPPTPEYWSGNHMKLNDIRSH